MSPARIIPKIWGAEQIFAATPDYCGKLLHFQAGARSSLHFHKVKDESWFCVTGEFDMEIGGDAPTLFKPRDAVRIMPGVVHRLKCRKMGTIFEVSTHDDPDDCVRIELSEAP